MIFKDLFLFSRVFKNRLFRPNVVFPVKPRNSFDWGRGEFVNDRVNGA